MADEKIKLKTGGFASIAYYCILVEVTDPFLKNYFYRIALAPS